MMTPTLAQSAIRKANELLRGDFKDAILEDDREQRSDLMVRALPRTVSTSRVKTRSEIFKETRVKDNHNLQTTTWKPAARPRDIIRLFGQPDQWHAVASKRVNDANMNGKRDESVAHIQHTQVEQPLQKVQFAAPNLQIDPIETPFVGMPFTDDQVSRKIEKNTVDDDGKRTIVLRGERIFADEVDMGSGDDITTDIDGHASDDYTDFDKQMISNGWPQEF
ncbi:hypothetical protein Tcan_15298 [Toxocara canis]|uniref:Uncharacterized protein n=1 Tax=Toxocara canis TaxID=6265 RepID=A0A0B2VXI9_TOXCA|nr:hypothetical protein Tcan_15298 [Toxocara canis]